MIVGMRARLILLSIIIISPVETRGFFELLRAIVGEGCRPSILANVLSCAQRAM